jgi:protein-L-isoaspartate(D-aspartate) O-methyltransferase
MTSPADISVYSAQRRRMVEEQLRGRGISDSRVLDAMLRVPRHEFAPFAYRDQAYEDHPLPIGEGQTISQPYIVALMLAALAMTGHERVLEIGTGTGYVTALLAELAREVISIERHAALANSARDRLSGLGYGNVRVLHGDGSRGLASWAPYDGIMVSAAALQLPPELVDQLEEGGRMIIPVGAGNSQQLEFIGKQNGEATIRSGEMCLFVPLISGDVSVP